MCTLFLNHKKIVMKKVSIYSTPTCHFCHLAKDFFDESGVEYTEYDVAADAEKRSEMMEATGQMGVPVIQIDTEYIVGFQEDEIKRLLDAE